MFVFFEIDKVDTVLMLLHCVTLAALLVGSAVIVESNFGVPGRGYQNGLASPVIQAADVILLLLFFAISASDLLGLLELLHFGPIFNIDGE